MLVITHSFNVSMITIPRNFLYIIITLKLLNYSTNKEHVLLNETQDTVTIITRLLP